MMISHCMVIYARTDMLIYSFASVMILFPEREKHLYV